MPAKARRRKRKPTALPSRLAALREARQAAQDALQAVTGLDADRQAAAEAALAQASRALAEEAKARTPVAGRLVRIGPETAREARVQPGTFRVLEADPPEFGVSVLTVVEDRPAGKPNARPFFVADHYCVAHRQCPWCRAAGLSEELAWNVERGQCGICCDRDDGADELTTYRTTRPRECSRGLTSPWKGPPPCLP
jgi:hypothetical protein